MAGEAWREAIDLELLAGWMDGRRLGAGAITALRLLTRGTQNLTLMFDRGGDRFVLRRPAAHPRPAANKTMRREVRVLAALKRTDVPHPQLVAACPEEDVLGAAFYLMEPIDGFNVTVGMPVLHPGDAEMGCDGVRADRRDRTAGTGRSHCRGAGRFRPHGRVSRTAGRTLAQTVVRLCGTYRLCRAASPPRRRGGRRMARGAPPRELAALSGRRMADGDGGSIINISSGTSWKAMTRVVAYAGAKLRSMR